ncbi:hypothetical protein HMPREF0880_02204 [Yokenella regensburgei ATCC 43003]|jgi:hypothetical protein|nr:hypothetical protein HMPREF0880_02204 [Yokenella regensburgei ATCC 43003]
MRETAKFGLAVLMKTFLDTDPNQGTFCKVRLRFDGAIAGRQASAEPIFIFAILGKFMKK